MTFRTMIYIIRAKTFRTRKNFPGSNATLLPGFLGLCTTLALVHHGTIITRTKVLETKSVFHDI